jgi:hypothetical protein
VNEGEQTSWAGTKWKAFLFLCPRHDFRPNPGCK